MTCTDTVRPVFHPCRRISFHTLVVASLLTLYLASTATAAETIAFQHESGKSMTARLGDQILWQFHYQGEQPKPYFHPVATPDGDVLTWNSPPDHRWHHGLWFSWKFLNGVNYWEPAASGKPTGRTEWPQVEINTTPEGRAIISMQLVYRTTDDPVLTEQRTITILPPESDGSYRMDWQCAFTAGKEDVLLDRTPLPNEPGGQVYGGYAGLSVRFAKELESREAMTEQGPVEFSAQSRFRGKANVMDYAGEIGGKGSGIAICDHPQNLNHPSPWYAIRSGVMSYYSPAVICYAPYTLKAGESFTLRYRVIVHRDKWQSDRLNQEYERFVTESDEGSKETP